MTQLDHHVLVAGAGPAGLSTAVTAADLLARARAMHRAYSGLRHEILDVVTAPGRLVVGDEVGVLGGLGVLELCSPGMDRGRRP